jgi:hypothetical protein
VFRNEEEPTQVDVDEAIPLLDRKLVDRDAVRERVDSRVVDEDVEMSGLRDDAVDELSRRLLLRDVVLGPSRSVGTRCGLLGTLGVDVGEVDQRAVRGEPFAASRSAIARPMPLAAPVTRLTLPSRSQRIATTP